jgi:hypothetical protein
VCVTACLLLLCWVELFIHTVLLPFTIRGKVGPPCACGWPASLGSCCWCSMQHTHVWTVCFLRGSSHCLKLVYAESLLHVDTVATHLWHCLPGLSQAYACDYVALLQEQVCEGLRHGARALVALDGTALLSVGQCCWVGEKLHLQFTFRSPCGSCVPEIEACYCLLQIRFASSTPAERVAARKKPQAAAKVVFERSRQIDMPACQPQQLTVLTQPRCMLNACTCHPLQAITFSKMRCLC